MLGYYDILLVIYLSSKLYQDKAHAEVELRNKQARIQGKKNDQHQEIKRWITAGGSIPTSQCIKNNTKQDF